MNSQPPVAVAGRVVAVLGTGTMGAPIARNLLRAGIPLRVWNRTPAKARAVVDALPPGIAVVAPTAAAAVQDCAVVLAMPVIRPSRSPASRPRRSSARYPER